jgi:hypothetical protein
VLLGNWVLCTWSMVFEPLGFPGNLSHLHAGLFQDLLPRIDRGGSRWVSMSHVVVLDCTIRLGEDLGP